MEYIITFVEGIISFISPCMLPILPLYISYFAGNEVNGLCIIREKQQKYSVQLSHYYKGDSMKKTILLAGALVAILALASVFYNNYQKNDTEESDSIPATLFIDADGNIVASQLGAMSENTLKNYIKTLLTSVE